MYPAQALFDGLYTVDDLPDTIIDVGLTFNKLNPPLSELGGIWYYETLDGGGGVVERIGLLNNFNGVWAYQGEGETTPCLITETREDQFADTYTVSGNPDFNQTVARTSLGFWIGEGTGVQESNATVFYMRCSDLRIGYSESDWDAWWMTLGASDTIAKKTGDQNTPEGSYPFGDIIGTMTVS
jgi:hypothetical protein